MIGGDQSITNGFENNLAPLFELSALTAFLYQFGNVLRKPKDRLLPIKLGPDRLENDHPFFSQRIIRKKNLFFLFKHLLDQLFYSLEIQPLEVSQMPRVFPGPVKSLFDLMV